MDKTKSMQVDELPTRKLTRTRLHSNMRCGAWLGTALAVSGGCAGAPGTDADVAATDGAQVTLPALPYGSKGDRADVVIGTDDRSFTPWQYPYSTVGQSEIGCTATMLGRLVAVMAAHCVQFSTGTITFGRGFNGSHTGESLSTIGWHWFAWGQSSFNGQDSTNDWAIIIMDRDPGLGWLGAAFVPLPTSPASANAFPWIPGWSTGYGTRNGVIDNLNRFKRGSVTQTGGGRYPNWMASYDIEGGDSGSSFVRDSDGRAITIQSAEVGANRCAFDEVNCVNLVSPSGAWWNSYIAALNANP